MVNRLSGTGSWWQVKATGMCRYPGALGVSLIAGTVGHPCTLMASLPSRPRILP
jgi:hypothetical protein